MERDKFLTEAMGERGRYGCLCCGNVMDKLFACRAVSHIGLDFSTWQGFGKLWEWAQEQEWWTDFMSLDDIEWTPEAVADNFTLKDSIITPCNLANAVYEFLKERNQQGRKI